MNDPTPKSAQPSIGYLPQGFEIERNIAARRLQGTLWRNLFVSSLLIGILALLVLIGTIVNDAFGYVALANKVDPANLASQPLKELSKEELVAILQANISQGLFRRLENDQPFTKRSQENVLELVYERVVQQQVIESYDLWESLTQREAIEQELTSQNPKAKLEFRSWLNWGFLSRSMASKAEFSGVRNALLGSLWMIAITVVVAFPLGVGAALYLEEYSSGSRISRMIETNINNLAGVPSIIYGMLGLAIFVRALGFFTSGSFLGLSDSNGRTIISAALTMALLILPLIIINAREAIRAVPLSLRQASYGLGATKWQTIWHHVLPQALPGILTGTILGISRAMGETAPLIVVGAATYIVTDPSSIFSKFTALPIQIYYWASQPQEEFRRVAAAAIIVLLIALLSLNTVAIVLRNRFRRSL